MESNSDLTKLLTQEACAELHDLFDLIADDSAEAEEKLKAILAAPLQLPVVAIEAQGEAA